MQRPGFAIRTLAAAIVAGALAACTSSTTTTTPPAPSSVTATVAIPQTAGTMTLPSYAGYSPAVQVAAGAPAGTTLTATSSTTAPANAPAPSAIRRSPQAIAGASPIFYATFTVSASIPSQLFTGETLGLPSAALGVNYFVEFDDITSSPATKLATVSGTATGATVAFNNTTGTGGANSPTLSTGHTYLMMFYTTPVSGPTPTPTATPTATPSAVASPTATPSASASPTTAPLANYSFAGASGSGSFTTSSGGTITLAPYANDTGGGSVSFHAPNGSTTITVADAVNNGDITPTGFPADSAGGTVFVYIKLSASADATFPDTPQMTWTASTFPGTSCYFDGYVNNGGAYAWQHIVGPVTPSGGTVTFPYTVLSAGQTVDFKAASPFYGAVSCR